MRYPFIVFYRDTKYAHIVDDFFTKNKDTLGCSVFIKGREEKDQLALLYDANYHMLVTYGNSFDEYKDDVLDVLDPIILKRHMHVTSNTSLDVNQFTNVVTTLYTNICLMPREDVRPVFSLFTTTFKSYEKIYRVYNSLKKQTLKYWEWVIVDDSPEHDHFMWLIEQFGNDPRIRLYRRSKNNGSIGNVKNESIGLCRGKYVLEMDHDDEIMPYTLKMTADAFDKHPEVGFIYMDFACLYEDGSNHSYGDFVSRGYVGYYSEKVDGKWRLVFSTGNMNNVTMSHLTCCPNHPRMWRRDVLLKLGSYCEYLPICDDFEILLRTLVGTKCAKIHKLGYYQYMNNGSNNFSLIRNGEINRIGPNYISPMFFEQFNANHFLKGQEAYEDEKYKWYHEKLWTRGDSYKPKFCNLVLNPDYDVQYCIVSYDALLFNIDKILELYANPRVDFLLLDNKCSNEYLWSRLEHYGLDRIKCYTLIDTPEEQLIKYFRLIYQSVPNTVILTSGIKRPLYNSELWSRASTINSLTRPEQTYLEIGVEYGQTFLSTHFLSKTGVDPDPKFELTNENNPNNSFVLHKLKSDDYFASLNEQTKQTKQTKFDVIFIDGMHHSDYFLRDFNNSLQILNKDGLIFVDDILPLNRNEQLKIPERHYYENGILKYGEEWTGDIWKVVYFILTRYRDKIAMFKYFYNKNFRGIGVFKFHGSMQIKADIKDIEQISYEKDFNNYCNVLRHFG